MKHIRLLLFSMLSLAFCGCMDDHDDPANLAYGNPAIGQPNTTIGELKSRYASVISNSGVEEITDALIVSGIVVGDDESGNIYKNLYIRGGSGTLVVGINATGIYATIPVGQKIAIDCKGLYIGGYGRMAQLGTLYQGGIGRMPEYTWKEHVKLVGKPDLSYPELTPEEVDEAWIKAANKDDAPFFVTIKGAEFAEADGLTTYAPEEEADGGNGVDRTLRVGSTNIIFRTSSYANFATEYMKTGSVDVTGMLTRYNSDWQFTARTGRDIRQTNNDLTY